MAPNQVLFALGWARIDLRPTRTNLLNDHTHYDTPFLRAKAYRARVGGVSPDTPFLRAKAYRARVGGSPRCGIKQIRAGGT